MENTCNKASGLLFIIVHVSTGHTDFQSNEIHISWEPPGLLQCFFSCEMAENTPRNALFKVCEGLLLPVFNSERNPPLSRSLPVRKCNTGLYFLFMGCFYQLMVCSHGRRKTNKHTHIHKWIHTYIHTHFRKAISRNQVCANCQLISLAGPSYQILLEYNL